MMKICFRAFLESLLSLTVEHFLKKFLPLPLRKIISLVSIIPRVQKGLASVARGKPFCAETLDAAAISLSYLTGDIDTAGTINFLLNIGDTLEDYTKRKSHDNLTQSLLITDETVTIVQDGEEKEISTQLLKAGDIVIVRAGSVIPVDGTVVEGVGMVNQASMTGEALPVQREKGSSVFASTILEEGEIKERIEKLFAKTGFKTSGIFTMDASRRSNHSNAYFTGFGKNKRIVLYDTLLKQLEPSEIEAVLGHELGHCKKHHIAKRMIVMIPLVFVSLLAASLIAKLPALYSAFGYEPLNNVAPYIQPLGLLFIGLVFEGYGNIVSLVSNFFSRKDEFQADAYSKEMCGTSQPLISALIKLNKENLTELEPPKIYSMFNYSHPPLMERIKALEN